MSTADRERRRRADLAWSRRWTTAPLRKALWRHGIKAGFTTTENGVRVGLTNSQAEQLLALLDGEPPSDTRLTTHEVTSDTGEPREITHLADETCIWCREGDRFAEPRRLALQMQRLLNDRDPEVRKQADHLRRFLNLYSPIREGDL